MRYTLSIYIVGSPTPLQGQFKTMSDARDMARDLAPKEERGGYPGAVKLITLTGASSGKQIDLYCYNAR